jgi:hypothetical protein
MSISISDPQANPTHEDDHGSFRLFCGGLPNAKQIGGLKMPLIEKRPNLLHRKIVEASLTLRFGQQADPQTEQVG